MQLRDVPRIVAAVVVAAIVAPCMSRAADMYKVTIVPEPGTTSPFAIGKLSQGVFTIQSNGSKVIIKPSSKDGDGGLTLQLTLKGVDCASYGGLDDPSGNNNDTLGKCGLAGSKAIPAMPARDHVMSLSVNFAAQDLIDVAGILFQIQNGVATFEANGKNKISGAALFGSLVTSVLKSPLGLGVIKFRDAYWVCTSRVDCSATVPCGSGQACIGGACVALGAACSSDGDCPVGQACFQESCVAGVLCTTNSDCTAPETCVNGLCAGQTVGGSGVRCNLHSDCAAATPTCADPGQVVACRTAPLLPPGPCIAGTVYAKTGITVGCDATLATCP